MSGKHSKPDRNGTVTDADGDVVSMSGTIEEPSPVRPYTSTGEDYR